MGVLWRRAGSLQVTGARRGWRTLSKAGRKEGGGRQCPQATPVGWNIGIDPVSLPAPSSKPLGASPRGGASPGCIFSSLCLPSCYKTPLPAPSPAPGLAGGSRRTAGEKGRRGQYGGCQGREEWVEGSSGVSGNRGSHCPTEGRRPVLRLRAQPGSEPGLALVQEGRPFQGGASGRGGLSRLASKGAAPGGGGRERSRLRGPLALKKQDVLTLSIAGPLGGILKRNPRSPFTVGSCWRPKG